MAEKYLNDTGLKYYHDRVANVKFADKTEFANLQTQVQGIANEGGEPNKIESIKLNGVTQTITDKVVDIIVADPDMSAYSTTEQMNTAISTAVAGANHISRSIVDTLPDTGDEKTIYMVSNGKSDGNNVYTEYMWVNNKFEIVGNTDIDLSDYVKKSDITTISTAEIDALFTE